MEDIVLKLNVCELGAIYLLVNEDINRCKRQLKENNFRSDYDKKCCKHTLQLLESVNDKMIEKGCGIK